MRRRPSSFHSSSLLRSMHICWAVELILAVVLAGLWPAVAQDLEPGESLAPYAVVVEKVALEDAWIEVTPLLGDREPLRLWLGDLEADRDDPILEIRVDVPPGPVEICTGAAGRKGVYCLAEHLDAESDGDSPDSNPLDSLPAEFLPGVAVSGQYVLGVWVVPGARVAVVPAGLEAPRPFTVPLAFDRRARQRGEPTREVLTDAEGRFVLPPLADGRYFLETILPTGRVHRSDPFEIALEEALDEQTRPDGTASVDPLPAIDLGVIDVVEGLSLEIRVADPSGEPVVGATVSARQGRTAAELETYQSETGVTGAVTLSGFRTDLPATVHCEAPGFRPWSQEYELVPALVLCDLEPFGQVRGIVVGPDGLAVPGAVATLEPVADPDDEAASETATTASTGETSVSRQTELGTEADGPAPPRARSQPLDGVGGFRFSEVVAGTYQVWLAAPGHERIGQSIEVAEGETLDLGTLALMAGREVLLRVVDAELGTPVAEAQVTAVNPPGAVDGVTDGEGELTFATRGDQNLELRIEAESFALEHQTLAPSVLEADEPVVVALERPGWIVASIWDEARNTPCTGCSLWVRPGEVELITDGFGEVLSPPLRPGTYRVYRPRLDHLGSTVVEQRDAEMRWVRVERGKGSRVQFGERREGIRVRYDPPVPAGWSLVTRGGGREARYHREVDGGFVVRQRPGESLELWLRYVDPEAGREVELAQGLLTPGADRGRGTVTLPRHDTSLEGKAHHPDGSAVAGVPVRLLTLDHRHRATGWTHGDGTFHLPHVEPGAYALHIGNRNLKFVSISPGLDLDTGTFLLTVGSY